jgi:hypothetical protein
MVEILTAPYDHESIPLVHASLVSSDAELSWSEDDSLLTAEAIPSPTSIFTESSLRSSVPFSNSHTSPESPTTEAQQAEQHEDCTRSEQPTQTQHTFGAGAAGAVFGLLLGGPFLALIFGFGSAFYSKQEGAAGDAARALGEIALVARDKAREVDGKHHIVNKSKDAAAKALEKLKKKDRDHHVQERSLKFLSFCWTSTLDFVREHQLIERGSGKLKKLLDKLAEKILEKQSRMAGEAASSENDSRRGEGDGQ